jgi:hypothetical protein
MHSMRAIAKLTVRPIPPDNVVSKLTAQGMALAGTHSQGVGGIVDRYGDVIEVAGCDLFYAEQGRAVELSPAGNNKWVVTGLAKSVLGLTHLIPLTFAEDLVTIGDTMIRGYIVRPLSFGEMGDLALDGFGQFPWGIQGRFEASGTLIEILEI